MYFLCSKVTRKACMCAN